MLDAGNYVCTTKQRQELKVGVPEETAWRQGYITDDDLRERGELLFKYGVTDLDVRKVIDSHHASGSIAMSRAVGSPGSSATAPRSSALQHAI